MGITRSTSAQYGDISEGSGKKDHSSGRGVAGAGLSYAKRTAMNDLSSWNRVANASLTRSHITEVVKSFRAPSSLDSLEQMGSYARAGDVCRARSRRGVS